MEIRNVDEELVKDAVLWCIENRAIVRFDVDVAADPRRPKRSKPGVLVALPALDVSAAHNDFTKAVELCRETAAAKLVRLGEKIGARA